MHTILVTYPLHLTKPQSCVGALQIYFAIRMDQIAYILEISVDQTSLLWVQWEFVLKDFFIPYDQILVDEYKTDNDQMTVIVDN